MKREFAQMTTCGGPLVLEDTARGLAGGNEVGDDNRNEAVERQLQGYRQNRLPERIQTQQPRRRQHQDRDARPQQDAGDERRFPAVGERSREQGL